MRKLHVAAAQIHAGGGVKDVLRRIGCQAKAAAAVGVDVVLFSEGVLQGYDYDLTAEWIRQVAEPLNGPACDAIVKLAAQYKLTILAGFFERDGEHYYNSVLVARPDGTRDVQRKHVLTGGEMKG